VPNIALIHLGYGNHVNHASPVLKPLRVRDQVAQIPTSIARSSSFPIHVIYSLTRQCQAPNVV